MILRYIIINSNNIRHDLRRGELLRPVQSRGRRGTGARSPRRGLRDGRPLAESRQLRERIRQGRQALLPLPLLHGAPLAPARPARGHRKVQGYL